MTDLQLPRPLIDPTRWPKGDALMSIFSLKYGGAFATRRGRSFVAPETFWIREASEEPSLVAVLRDERLPDAEIVTRSPLPKAEQDEWMKVGAKSFRIDSALRVPTLLEWSREVFPAASSEAGEVLWLRELRDYESQLGGGAPSLDRLRFLPAYLRTKKAEFAPTASAEWARVQALFSPQDDSRGEGPTALMNPTLQIVTNKKQMFAYWRVDGVLRDREITWEQAAVLDEMRETPRIARSILVKELSARKFALPEHASFETVIAYMVQDGLILSRP